MGVTHKFTDDVVSFIVAQKRAHPQIGCRPLTERVRAKFHIAVSKSSVNSVLMQAGLSSPVGRRSVSTDSQERTSHKPATKPRVSEPKTKTIPVARKPKTKPPHKKSPQPYLEPAVSAAHSSVRAADTEEMSNLEHELNFSMSGYDPKDVFENAGIIFLKAAQWDLAAQSVTEKIFKENFADRSDHDCQMFADAALLARVSRASSPDDITADPCGLLAVVGAGPVISGAQIKSMIEKLDLDKELGIKLSIELSTLLQRIATLKLVAQNDAALYFNISSRGVSFVNVQSDQDSSLANAAEFLKNNTNGNVQSDIFDSLNNAENKEDAIGLLRFIYGIYENVQSEKLQYVALLDRSANEITRYPYHMEPHRKFVLAVNPQSVSLSSAKHAQGMCQVFNKTLYYDFGPLSEPAFAASNKVTAILIRETPDGSPIRALLTNQAPDPARIKKAVAEFALRFPGLHSALNPGDPAGPDGLPDPAAPDAFLAMLEERSMQLGAGESFDQLMTGLFSAIHLWSQRCFWGLNSDFVDENTMSEKYYRLRGIWQRTVRCLFVLLFPPPGDEKIRDLKIAVDRLNRRAIVDPSGRRVFVTVLE